MVFGAAVAASAQLPGQLSPWAIVGQNKEPTLEQKIGQMVVMGFAGTSPNDQSVQETIEQIKNGKLGGVIFYSYNIINPVQTSALTAAFSEAAGTIWPAFPIALDQEGGLVQRLSGINGFVSTPSAEKVAQTYSPKEAYSLYRRMAAMIKKAGFTWNLAPVVDLRGNPDDPEKKPGSPIIGGMERSFSDQPQIVVEYASAFIRAHRDEGIQTTLKHFPGHGLASGDSHAGLAHINDNSRLLERAPFSALIRAGLADSIMAAHLVDFQVDPDNPVTLSPGFLVRELRQAENFNGLIISDDLDMGAILKYYSFKDAVVKAILAGNDVLLFSNNPAAAKNVSGFQPDYHVAEKVIEVVKAAISSGILTESRIEESWRRIIAFRNGRSPYEFSFVCDN